MENNLEEAGLASIAALKTFIHKPLVDSKLLQLKLSIRNTQKDRATEEIFRVLNKVSERFGAAKLFYSKQ